MKNGNSSPPSDLPLWGGLIVTMLIFTVQVIGLSIALLGLDSSGQPLNYQRSYQGYEEARRYFTQFESPSLDRRYDGKQPTDPEVRSELVELRKAYANLAYDKLFAGRTIHSMIVELLVVWLALICCIHIVISLITSLFGAHLLRCL